MIAAAAAALAAGLALVGEERAYELDVAAPGQASLAPIPPQELAAALQAHHFGRVVLWFAPDDPAAASLPREPHARQLDSVSGVEPSIAVAAAPFVDQQLRVAIGRRRAKDVETLVGSFVDRTIVVEAKDGPPLELSRASRPAVRTVPWSGELWAPETAAVDEIALSSRLLIPTALELKRRQTLLDLDAADRDDSQDPADADSLLLIQSKVASSAAEQLGGVDSQALLPFENEWIGAAPAGRLPILRRGESLIDLEELCFSLDPQRRSLLELGAHSSVEGVVGTLKVQKSLETLLEGASNGRADPFDRNAIEAFLHLHDSHRRAGLAFANFLARGDDRARTAARAALQEIEQLLPALGSFADPWRRTLAADRALLDAAEPWRLRRQTWVVSSPELVGAKPEVTLAHADDPRLGAWSSRVEEALGGRELELWKLLPVHAGLEVTLRTDVALRDPRNVRLRVGAAARRTVRVNGSEAVAPLASDRGPLLATLPLPAGANSVEVVLVLDGTDGRVELELDRLPSRVEGIVLDPERASRVHEPVVRLNDPTALGSMSLVRPVGRTVRASAESSARASLPFPLSADARVDVWLHVLPLPDRAARLQITFDEGAARDVDVPSRPGWTWIRAAAPATLKPGDHALHVDFPVENVRVDMVVLMPSELSFPRPPADDLPLAATAWRFDPLGSGIVLDLPPLRAGELFDRSFTLDQGGSYDVYVWLKGSDPLAQGQRAELELNSPSGRQRFVLPAGTPYEEWVALGRIVFNAGDRIEMKAQGSGALARVSFAR